MNDNEPLFSLNPEADGISYAFVFHRLNFGPKSEAEQCLKAKAPQRVGNPIQHRNGNAGKLGTAPPRSIPKKVGRTFSPKLLLCKQRAQAREKLCFAEGFLQDGRGPDRQQRRRLR